MVCQMTLEKYNRRPSSRISGGNPVRIRATCPIEDQVQLSITMFRTPKRNVAAGVSNSSMMIIVSVVVQGDTVELEERVGNLTTGCGQSTIKWHSLHRP